MEFIYTDGSDHRFNTLCRELDDYLNFIVGGEKQRSQYIQYNTTDDIHDVILAMEDGELAGAGSFKRYDDSSAEIKRVFIRENYRQKHIAADIMEKLEKEAKEKGFKRLILETGEPLAAAMNLYEKTGFRIVENYGQYKDMKSSICMAKDI